MNNHLIRTHMLCTVTRTSKKMVTEYIKEGYLIPFKEQQPGAKLDLTVADIVMMGIMRGIVPGGGDKEPLQELAKGLHDMVSDNYTRLDKLNWIIVDLVDMKWKIVDSANAYDSCPNEDSRLLKSIKISEFTNRFMELNIAEPKVKR